MQEPEEDAQHDLTLAVWDVASPLIVEEQSTVKIGVKCSRGCELVDADIELRDEDGCPVARGTLGDAPYTGTAALYWTELRFTAHSAGPHTWTATVDAGSIPAHQDVSSSFSFIAVRPPDHILTVTITGTDGDGIEAVELRAGVFRAQTDVHGVATLALPAGTHELNMWKKGYELASSAVEAASDLQMNVVLVPVPVVEEEYWR